MKLIKINGDAGKIKYKPKYQRREIRISSVQPLSSSDISENYAEYMSYILGLMDKSGALGSDIACIPESIQSQFGNSPEECPDTEPGKFAGLFKEKARKYKMYVLVHALEKINNKFRSVAVLINRKGQIVGRYQKIFVTETSSSVPGSTAQVFTTDFGKIGVLICFDACFPELATLLSLKGAEIIFNPHAVDTGEENNLIIQRARALDNSIYFVSCGYGRKIDRDNGHFGRSCIIDPNGLIIADAGYKEGIASCLVDLENKRMVYGYGGGWEAGPFVCKERLLRERRPDIAEQLSKEMHKQAGKTWFASKGRGQQK